MSFPAGALPGAAFLANAFVPVFSAVFTSGGSDLDLTDPANGIAPCAYELYCTSTGNIVARLAGDSADRTYGVVAGQILPGAFVLLKGSSTANCIARR